MMIEGKLWRSETFDSVLFDCWKFFFLSYFPEQVSLGSNLGVLRSPQILRSQPHSFTIEPILSVFIVETVSCNFVTFNSYYVTVPGIYVGLGQRRLKKDLKNLVQIWCLLKASWMWRTSRIFWYPSLLWLYQIGSTDFFRHAALYLLKKSLCVYSS